MSPDDFIAAVCREFKVEESYTLEAHLVDDVGLDSVDLFELVLFIEELAGMPHDLTELPDLAYPIMETFGDAYAYLGQVRSVLPSAADP